MADQAQPPIGIDDIAQLIDLLKSDRANEAEIVRDIAGIDVHIYRLATKVRLLKETRERMRAALSVERSRQSTTLDLVTDAIKRMTDPINDDHAEHPL